MGLFYKSKEFFVSYYIKISEEIFTDFALSYKIFSKKKGIKI